MSNDDYSIEDECNRLDSRIDEVIEKLDRLRTDLFELQRKVDYDCASDRDLSNLRSEFTSLERTVQSLEHRGRW